MYRILNTIPLHLAPQTSQVNTTFSSPFALSSKFPQPAQKTRDPIAAILDNVGVVDFVNVEVSIIFASV
jgi:hypothetical protein